MNALGLQLVWVGLQVSLFCLAGIALYAVARRRDPASGAWSAGAALAITVLLSLAAVSPWPRWWSLSRPNAATSTARDSESKDSDNEGNFRLAPGMMSGPLDPNERNMPQNGDITQSATAGSAWNFGLPRLWDELSNPVADDASVDWRWPAWLGCLLVAGISLAFIRLLVAVASAHRFRMRARPVDDTHAGQLLHCVCEAMPSKRIIELREASFRCSPSTIGWRRPAIVLPVDWRTWNDHELRAVLAHEVAHVARNDFALALISQVGVALHFYNPLVRFLSRRLRLEQEIAADLRGAQLAGGRQRYLVTLAEMALRTSDTPLVWAARPFLPTRGTLMRRIEMLHREKALPSLAISRPRRTILAAMLLVVAGAVAGVRGPQGGAIVAAGQPEVQTKANSIAASSGLDFVAPDAQFVLALRPAESVKIESLKTLRAALENFGLFKTMDVPLEKLDACTFFSAHLDDNRRAYRSLILRSSSVHDWKKLGDAAIGKNERVTVDGQTYFQSTGEFLGPMSAYWLPDDRTIVLTRKDAISRLFALKGGERQPDWAERWQSFAADPVVAMISPLALVETMKQLGGKVDSSSLDELDGPVFFLGTAGANGLFQFDGEARCKNTAAANAIKSAVDESLQGLARTMHQALADRVSVDGPMANVVLGLLDATELTVENSSVRSHTVVNEKIGQKLTAALGPARIAAARALSVNKLKQIGIAFFNYHDVHNQFPPATIMGPDGKTPHSWRVAILPYLDQKELYDRYRFNEPWDSERNRKLIDDGTDIYRVPMDEPSNECGYFALVGPSTAFDPNKAPISVRTVVDGTSMTMGIVEARRNVPWTKPEDIAYDPNKPLPKFGGYFPGGFDTQFLDGSVRFLADNVDETTLRQVITIDGREPVDVGKLHP